MFNTPILFLIFNRPDTTREVFEQIAKVKPTKLYVAADGPRFDRPDEAILCADVRRIVADRINWDCEVKYLYRGENLGCKLAVSGAINWFFEQVEAGIILEDDCLPDLSFFPFCEELLHRFKDDERILAINGCNYNFEYKEASYFYSRYMNSWGWATWRRAAKQVNYNMKDWGEIEQINFLRNRLKSGILDFDSKWFEHWKLIFDQLNSNEIDTWDYYWIYHQFKFKKKSIMPSNNLVQNIGFNVDATHTSLISHPAAHLTKNQIVFPMKHNKWSNSFNSQYEEAALKPVCYMYERRSISFLLKRKIVRLPLINFLYKLKNRIEK